MRNRALRKDFCFVLHHCMRSAVGKNSLAGSLLTSRVGVVSANLVEFSAGPINNPSSWVHRAMKSNVLKAVMRLFHGKNVKRKQKF